MKRKTAHAKKKPGTTPSARRAVRRLLPFARPYRGNFALAALGLFIASLIGFLNLLMIKPVVELLAGESTRKTTIAHVTTTPDGAHVRIQLHDDGRPPDETAGDGVFSAWSPEDDATSRVVAIRVPGPAASRMMKRGISGGPGAGALRPVEGAWDRVTAPVRAPLARINQWFRDLSAAHPGRALLLLAAIIVGLAAAGSLITFGSHYHIARGCYGMVADVREALFRKVIGQDYLFFAQHSTGHLESRIQSDVASIRRGVELLMRNGFQAPFQLLFLGLLLLGLNFRLTLIALLVGAVLLVPLLYLARIVKRITRQTRRQADRMASGLEESLRNYPVVKFFQSEGFETEKFAKRNRSLLRLYLKNRLAQFGSAPLTQFGTAVGRAAVLVVGGFMVLRGTMEFSTLAVYLVALTRFFGPGRAMSRATTSWPVLAVSAERMGEILELEPKVSEEHDAQPLGEVREGIEFRDVSFAYHDQEAIESISFRIPVDRTFALVGPSGSGKTTLVCLLARLFDPDSGAIEIDGVDIRRYRLADLRRAIATVTQDTILFNDTVARNIAYPDADPDLERVAEAARAAHAHDFILELAGGEGYDTIIGQGGQRLSGGQRQRLAIARAFYRDPQILVFDEATSSLDEESQALVQDAVTKLFQGRTVVIVAHRLSTVRRADEILVLHQGRLVERGSHDELLRRDGIYASLNRISRDDELIDTGSRALKPAGEGDRP